jgi:hypothetical protein
MAFQYFNPFRKPSVQELKKTQLEESQRQLLLNETAAAYHQKLTEFYREDVIRLQSGDVVKAKE